MRYTTLIQIHLIAFGKPYVKINRHLRKYTTNKLININSRTRIKWKITDNWTFNRNSKRKNPSSCWNLCHCLSKTKVRKLWWVQLAQCRDQSVRLIGSKGTKWSGNVVHQIWNLGSDDGFSQDGTGKLWLVYLVCTVKASKWQMRLDQMGQNAMGNGALRAH